MKQTSGHLEGACPSCGSAENEADASYCQTCGSKLKSSLLYPPGPPEPCEPGKSIAGRFSVQSLLWTAPTYNAYDAVSADSTPMHLTIIEQRLNSEDPLDGVSPVTPAGNSQGMVSGSLEVAAPAFER